MSATAAGMAQDSRPVRPHTGRSKGFGSRSREILRNSQTRFACEIAGLFPQRMQESGTLMGTHRRNRFFNHDAADSQCLTGRLQRTVTVVEPGDHTVAGLHQTSKRTAHLLYAPETGRKIARLCREYPVDHPAEPEKFPNRRRRKQADTVLGILPAERGYGRKRQQYVTQPARMDDQHGT